MSGESRDSSISQPQRSRKQTLQSVLLIYLDNVQCKSLHRQDPEGAALTSSILSQLARGVEVDNGAGEGR
ncbi:hypothetical protein N7457_004101 [Penicillium paradoxum]|uniref:uncharacterized protein n=1 Tax=Penicillium paradoxum TaxID=176176 RepID=UPI002546C2EA|nr:uncharacterized protein N7457_004101 [Penicillium paradoxum]KAJ5782327.1 hypothetical protein N7457_004101 [Penicillium paradoxum]